MSTEVVEEKVEEQENAEESQATEEELSAVEDLSDDEVDKLAKGEPLPEEKVDETDQSADSPEVEADAETTETTEETETTQEPEKEELKGDEEAKAETDEQPVEGETVNVSKAEWDKMQAHAKTQAEFEQKRSNEVGVLRKKVNDLTAERLRNLPASDDFTQVESDKLNELAASGDMVGYEREKTRIQSERESERSRLTSEHASQRAEQEKAILATAAPEFESHRDGVKAYLADTGLLTAEAAADFVADPSKFEDGGFIARLAQDASSNEALKKEVEELKAKLSGVQKTIATNASKPKSMGNIGTSTADMDEKTGPSLTDIEDMSDEELAKMQPK